MEKKILIVMPDIYSIEGPGLLQSKTRRIFGHLADELPILHIGLSNLEESIIHQNLRVMKIKGRTGYIILDILKSITFQLYIAKRVVKGYRPIVFCGHSIHGIFGLLFSFYLRCPRITHIIGDSVAFKRIKPKLFQIILQIITRFIENLIRRSSGIVLVHSTFLQNLAIESGVSKERILFIPRAVDAKSDIMMVGIKHNEEFCDFNDFNDFNASKYIKILMAARLVTGKGVDILLQSLNKLINKFPCLKDHVILFIAGDGDKRPYFEDQTHKLGLTDNVKFLGFIKHTKLLELYNHVNIFVQPSIVREGLGMSLQESCRAGLPIITSDIGGVRDLVKHYENGLLIPPGNVDALTEALYWMIENTEMRKKMGERSRVIEAEYSMKRVDKLEELKHRLLSL